MRGEFFSSGRARISAQASPSTAPRQRARSSCASRGAKKASWAACRALPLLNVGNPATPPRGTCLGHAKSFAAVHCRGPLHLPKHRAALAPQQLSRGSCASSSANGSSGRLREHGLCLPGIRKRIDIRHGGDRSAAPGNSGVVKMRRDTASGHSPGRARSRAAAQRRGRH